MLRSTTFAHKCSTIILLLVQFQRGIYLKNPILNLLFSSFSQTPLQIFSRYDADQFAKKLGENSAPPLCALTNGVHLHTIQYQHEDDFHRVMEQLEKEGILFVES